MTAREEEVAVVEEHDPELARLQHEIDMLTRGGIIEVAVRNPNVAEYMKHWEARAEKAEAERDKLREALTEISSPTQSLNLLWWQIRAREALKAAQ